MERSRKRMFYVRPFLGKACAADRPRAGGDHACDSGGGMVFAAANGFQESGTGIGVASGVWCEHPLLAGFRLLFRGRQPETSPPHLVLGGGGAILSDRSHPAMGNIWRYQAS